MRLRDYPHAVRSRWRLAACGLVVGALAGLLAWWLVPARYSSETTLYVATRTSERPNDEAYDATLMAVEKVRTYRALVLGPEFVSQVAVDAGVRPDDVRRGLVASVPPGTPIISVTATAGSSATATAITRAVADRFRLLVGDLEPVGTPIVGQVVQPPTERAAPVSAGPGMHLAGGLAAGALLGLLAAVSAHAQDRTVRGAVACSRAAGVPVLGSVPSDPAIRRLPLSLHVEDDSPRSEAYRQVRTNLDFVTVGVAPQVVVVAGAAPTEGRSTVVVELATALAEAGRRVVVVDTDLRGHGAGILLGLETSVGLSGVLSRQVSLEDAVQPWGRGRFDVVTAGRLPPNPTEFLDSSAFAEVLSTLRLRYDVVLLDSPPCRTSADAGLLCARADAVVLVVHHAQSDVEEVEAGADDLRATGTPLIGVVLVGVPRRRDRHTTRWRPSAASRARPNLVATAGARSRAGASS